MTYQEKYVKYKNKYLKLKNNKMYGGFHDIDGISYDDDIYCKDKQEIVPYKKQIIKMLDILQIKLEIEIQQKKEETLQHNNMYNQREINEKTKKCENYDITSINPLIVKECLEFKKYNEQKEKNQKIIEQLIKNYNKIDNKSKNDNYCDTKIPDILSTLYNHIYKDSISEYVNSEDFKCTFEDLFFNMSPINFLSETFYPITYPNFTVYRERIINGTRYYFEIYTNIINELPIQYYLLTDLYTLILTDKPDELIKKKLEFPLLSEEKFNTHEIYDNNRYIIEGFVLTYDLEKMKNILKMYFLHVPVEFKKWIKYFLSFNLSDLTLVHNESFNIMDTFIISNNYNIYFENIYINILSLDTSLINLTKQEDTLIKAYFKEKISDLRYNIYEDSKVKHPIINMILATIEPIQEQLINAYNCGKINDSAKTTIKNTSKLFTNKLKELNEYLKFTRTQILTLIVSELYNEIYDFLVLSKIIIPYDLLCILNSIYYYRIYNLPNIKNLINYQSQFSISFLHDMYEPVINSENDIDKYVNNKNDEQSEIILKIFYNNIAMKIPNYIMFKYTDSINKLNIVKSDGTMLNNHPICGEITILNLINLLIVDNDKLNFELLPSSTIPQLLDFYREYNTLDKLKSNFVINKFANILWKIPFDLINNRLDKKTDVYLHYDSDNKNGVEIRPSYENICRILIYLFNIEDLNIYNYEGTILKSLNIDSETLKKIFSYIDIKSYYVDEIIKVYEYVDKGNGSIAINLKKFGILSLNKNHSEYNLSSSNNYLLTNLKHYTGKKTNFAPLKDRLIQGDKFYLHSSYCGIMATDYIFTHLNNNLYLNNETRIKFLKKLLIIHNYDVSYDDIFTILNKFFDIDYDTYRIVNDRINIFNFIALYKLDNLTKMETNFIKKIILKYNELGIKIIDTIDTSTNSELLFNFIDKCDSSNIRSYFPYEISIETFEKMLHLSIYSFLYFNKFTTNFNLSLIDFSENIIFKMFKYNYNINDLNYNEDDNSLSDKYPNLLINIIKSDDIEMEHYSNIINILCDNYGYNINRIEFNLEIFTKLSQITIENDESKHFIITEYIRFIEHEISNPEILINMIINYNLLENIEHMRNKRMFFDKISHCILTITDFKIFFKILNIEIFNPQLKNSVIQKYLYFLFEVNYKDCSIYIYNMLEHKYDILTFIYKSNDLHKNEKLLKILEYMGKFIQSTEDYKDYKNIIISIYHDILIFVVQQSDEIYSIDKKIEYIYIFMNIIKQKYTDVYNHLIKNILIYIPNLFELLISFIKTNVSQNIYNYKIPNILKYIADNHHLLEYALSKEIFENMLFYKTILCDTPEMYNEIFFIWNKYFHENPPNYINITLLLDSSPISGRRQTTLSGPDDEDDINEDKCSNNCCVHYITYIKKLYKENILEYQELYDKLNIIFEAKKSNMTIRTNVPYLIKQIRIIITKLQV